jgi:hypothetical protein
MSLDHRAMARSLLLALLLVLSAAAGASAADRVISSPPVERVERISASEGVVVWFQEMTPDAGDYQLFQWTGGAPTRVPLRGTEDMDSLDLGPGRHGGAVAVYSRCHRQCDLFAYGFGSRRERRLSSLSSRRYDETAAATWRGRYVFTRQKHDDRRNVFLRGRRFGLFKDRPVRRLSSLQPFSTELRGNRVAFLTSGSGRSRVSVKRFDRRGRGRVCAVAVGDDREGAAGTDVDLANPLLAGDYVYWLRAARPGRLSPPGEVANVRIARQRVPSRRCRSPGRQERSRDLLRGGGRVDWFAIDGRRFFYIRDGSVLEATDPLGFTR